jgi:hypothetical protein
VGMTGFASKRAVARSLQDDIIDRMAEDMARKIDKDLLDDMMIAILKDEDWVETKVNPAYTDMGMLSGKYEEWYSKTAEWIHLNAQGDYKLIKGQWLFKDPRDATMFILRWL